MNAIESDLTPERSERTGFPIPWAVLVLFVLIYPLSVGPVAKYYNNRPVPATVQTFYVPVQILADKYPPVKAFFIRYIGLWGVK